MDFAFTFLLTNLLGFVVYYIIPTAYVTVKFYFVILEFCFCFSY